MEGAVLCHSLHLTQRPGAAPRGFDVQRIQLLHHRPAAQALCHEAIKDGLKTCPEHFGGTLTLLGNQGPMTQHHAELLAANAGGDQESPLSCIEEHPKTTEHPISQDAPIGDGEVWRIAV